MSYPISLYEVAPVSRMGSIQTGKKRNNPYIFSAINWKQDLRKPVKNSA